MTKFENLKTKLQENKKFRTQFASVLVAAVVVVGCAVAIPIGVHANGVKKAAAEREAAVRESIAAEQAAAEAQTTEPTTEAPTETIPETTAVATVTENTTAKKSASANSGNSGSAKKSASASTTKKSSSSSKSSGNSGNKGSAAAAQTTFPSHDWPKAKVDAIIAEAWKYAQNLGFVRYDSLEKNNSSWSFPAMSTDGDEQVVLDDLKWQINQIAEIADWDCGIAPGIKIAAEREPCQLCHNADIGLNDYQWTFYVMY